MQEIWESEGYDGKYDPVTLFNLKDYDRNGFLDVEEVETLFQHELDKVYQLNITEDDMMER